MTPRKRRSERPPDIEIGARASAKKLRFRRKPKTKVEFEGGTRVRSDDRIQDVELESDSRTERHNLPDEVEPGVVYHTVEVGWAAQARLQMPDDEEETQGER
jgi:hypothetical protein